MGKIVYIIFDVILATIIKIVAVCMVLSVLIQVFSRNLPVMGISFMWTEELGRLTFMWLCMLSVATSYAKGQQIAIDFFYLRMRKSFQTICDYAILILILIFSPIITIHGTRLLNIVALQRSPVMEISMFWFYLAIPVGCGLIVIFTALCLIDRIFFKGKYVSSLSTAESESK
jgi:TRAP-type C4-dicarboxylate transport system permease small subunit